MNVPAGGRLTGDGRITFPMRGLPPANPPEGWHVDPDDDYVWIQDYQPCKHRECNVGIQCPNSKKIRQGDFCQLLRFRINPAVCGTCSKIEA